ncbi:GGDEF domain-containing protein [Aeromonas caviae]|uniref:diguanylate cyclase n=1 Tax=Aeromonas caviae TaxID=648 RepID=A0AAJ5Z5D3_AERCA|nr:GGDEF domain-containing protein [Aeromonas caviae]MBL0578069.1 diguanylate cyclase [Aeromonas caviae]MCX4032767.1 GGDEF domain-containing protein [Aeromonas caviae]MDX7797435.1 GGDEF domain-containing protein [Aeromonas caviae]ULH04201.1 GGDEF domain-containing protein [Aeromonas caviae]WFF96988.1 GGDEF domain-containing protein [Aeromonas caviae]
MNDMAAVTGQLARLRESLQQKQQELDGMASFSDAERTRSIQFIGKLMQACRGHDRELDNRLAKLKQKLEGNPPLTSIDADLNAIEKLLQQHSHTMEESISLTRAAIDLGSKQLKTIKGFPEDTRRALKEFLASPESYGIGDHQKKVIRLLEFYQQAIKIQLLPRKPLIPPSVEIPTELSSPAPTDSFDIKAHAQISDELQRLITELDFAGAVGESLADIRRQLLGGITPALLAEVCLQIIELIIEGTREERKASQAFLSTLNESLSSVHYSFTESLDEGRALQNAAHLSGQALERELAAIDRAMAAHDSPQILRGAISGHLDTIRRLQQEREEMANRERHLLTHLSNMEAKLRLMKDETAEYKKRLTIQKHKLFLDSLTQVHNRAALDERLELEYKRWLRYGTPLCLAIIDIDHFKHINDNYGHMAGDKALKVVAKALQNALRDTDFIARFGGEEFVVLLPNINPDKYQKPLENLRQTIKSIPFRFRDARVEITISIGATLFRTGDHTTDAFERADKALYSSKHSGRDQVNLA